MKSTNLNGLPESISKLKALKHFEFNHIEDMEIPKSVQVLINKIKPKKLVRWKKVYSEDVKISFTKMRIVPKLRVKDDNKIQKVNTSLWEQEDGEWDGSEDEIVFSSDEIYVLSNVEIDNYAGVGYLNRPLPRKLHLKRKGGIRVKDLREAFHNHLPDYGDYHFYEFLEYMYDYDGIPTYYLFIGS